ncbi:MAG: phage holin family protein [Candidatus Daviesbacteria bacterium]|nr:MAG: phage holin family protein [Candidatus Daviesbacteria bacterium]
MKRILRYYLINLVALYFTTQIIKGVSYEGGYQTLLLGGLIFTVINLILVPVLKVLLLPLNLLTLGMFSWIANVVALYALMTILPQFKLLPYDFPGASVNGFTIPAIYLSTLWVAVSASFLIGLFTHFFHWLVD